MSLFKIFQIEKNHEDIRKSVLTNIVKMLTERKLLDSNKLEENIKKIINILSDDYTYSIQVDSYHDDNDKFVSIKIIHQKITAIGKQSGISDFLYKYKDNPKIIVVKSISTKALQYISNNFPKAEVFLEDELLINLVDHIFVPRYEILHHETDDFKKFCETYHCKKRNIPKLFKNDPAARYYNLQKNDIVRIIRPSDTAGFSSFYRIVV